MKPLGDGFIKLIKMMIAPIIFCTVVTGIASMQDIEKGGRGGVLAALACVLTSLATAAAPTLGWLTLARALTGGAAAAIVPMTMAWIGDRVAVDERPTVLARLLGATVGGSITGHWMGGVFADTLGWRVGFVALSLVFAVAGLALCWHLRRQPVIGRTPLAAQATDMPGQLKTVMRHPAARRLLGLALLNGMLAFGAMAFIAAHLHGRFGLSLSLAGAIVAMFGVGGLVYSRSAAWLLARAGRARIGGGLTAGAWLLLAWWPDWRLAPLLCGLGGLGQTE